MSAKELVSNPKVAAAVVAGTTGAGLSTYLDWIPTDIGKLATLAGLTLSVVLIYVHLRKGHAEIKKTHLETEILKKMREDLDRRAAEPEQ